MSGLTAPAPRFNSQPRDAYNAFRPPGTQQIDFFFYCQPADQIRRPLFERQARVQKWILWLRLLRRLRSQHAKRDHTAYHDQCQNKRSDFFAASHFFSSHSPIFDLDRTMLFAESSARFRPLIFIFLTAAPALTSLDALPRKADPPGSPDDPCPRGRASPARSGFTAECVRRTIAYYHLSRFGMKSSFRGISTQIILFTLFLYINTFIHFILRIYPNYRQIFA